MFIQWSKRPENVVQAIDPPLPINDDFGNEYIKKVYEEAITKSELDLTYHALVSSFLKQGVASGFGGGEDVYSEFSQQGLTLRDLNKNIYKFSAAKQYQQVRQMSALLYEKGEKVQFKDFQETADKIFYEYNKNYLKAEYATSVGQAQSARDWLEFVDNKEQFPILQYHTQEDGRVRDEHAKLDGIKRPVDDKFWNSYMPKNGWRCRCFVTAHEDEKITDLSKRDIPKFGTEGFPELFDMNPGKDKYIFDPKKHPYFFVARGDANLKKNNFNLPIK